MTITDFLLEKGLIQEGETQEVESALDRSGGDVEKVLAERGMTPEDILSTRADFLGVPAKNLEGQNIPFEVLEYIPEESAVHYRFVPLAVREGVLEVGMVDPESIEAKDALQFISVKNNLPFKIFLISAKDFERVLQIYKNLTGEVTKALSELETELSQEDLDSVSGPPKTDDLSDKTTSSKTTIIEDAPVTKIVATVLRYAIEGKASDVHIEHMGDRIRVRFRIDGTLNTSLLLPTKVHSAVVARVKILSNMKLDERRKPQDGRFSAKIEGRKIDFRVSTFPAYYGEKVVMRILDAERGVLKLDQMGFSPETLALVQDAIKRPYGLILLSGPTGSGKTTTLYSMLNEIDRDSNNVLSLEDPVEYNVAGMNQSQVHPEIGYTFATGLRTTLRQDPDIIMVGEIRDKETAQLAVQAALTGHLVFSTIHTNSAIGVIPRLIDMGVDPYLIAPTLVLAMAQRLVKKMCPGAGKPIPVEGAIKMALEKQFEDLPAQFRGQVPFGKNVYEASATPECAAGTKGRTGVFEAFRMDKELEQIILKEPTEPAIFKHLRAKGMLTMREDAIMKAFQQQVPFEEVNGLV